jgi:membrane-associated HD superfamily phosphohydrolase
MSDMSSIIKLATGAIVLGSCYLASFILISKFVGSSDAWNQIQDRTGTIWSLSMFGAVAMFLAAFFYFRMDNNYEKMMYFIFTMTFIAVGLAYSALGIALIHKN